ncbi:DUF7002 family protein [Bradyrhizobium sp. B120]|uniref:DUF7002 family protein n=1 Tax=Bradyrhizobium sp. B120 TaxID=3410088 RepID=UPI003B987404
MATRALPVAVYHLVDAANWDRVRRDGLKCTADLIGRDNAACGEHRPRAIAAPDGSYIRDQAPMPPSALARCLDPPLVPADWYRMLNGLVFFWFDRARVDRHVRAAHSRQQHLLTIDVARLVERYAAALRVTPFNTGNAKRKPASRGPRSFVPVDEWLANGWIFECQAGGKPRPPSHRPAELVSLVPIPDVLELCVGIELIEPKGSIR